MTVVAGLLSCPQPVHTVDVICCVHPFEAVYIILISPCVLLHTVVGVVFLL